MSLYSSDTLSNAVEGDSNSGSNQIEQEKEFGLMVRKSYHGVIVLFFILRLDSSRKRLAKDSELTFIKI